MRNHFREQRRVADDKERRMGDNFQRQEREQEHQAMLDAMNNFHPSLLPLVSKCMKQLLLVHFKNSSVEVLLG